MASISSSPAAPDPLLSHQFSCNTCQVAFRNNDLQKGHMKSDWHRYNLKRRVASLPPIASEVFTEKVLQARAASSAEADKAGFERGCDVCQKSYYSQNSYQNHLGSQKHRARAAAAAAAAHRRPVTGTVPPDDEASSMMSSTFSLGDPVPTNNKDEVDSDAEEEFSQVIEGLQKTDLKDRGSPVKRPSNPHLSAQTQHKADHRISPDSSSDKQSVDPISSGTSTLTRSDLSGGDLKRCLFCNYTSPTVPLSVHHMERIHGMFIPERKYLVNLEGLIGALQHRIHDLHECLFCGKIKANVFAVQTHMRDKGHCKIPYTTEAEQVDIGEFYDFRSTYSDDGDGDSDTESGDGAGQDGGGGAKLGARRAATMHNEDGDVIMADRPGEDGWETDSSASSLDSADLTAVPMEQHNFHQYERLDRHPHHSRDDPRAHHQRDGWHSHAHKHAHAVFYDEYELHLPSGKSVGHRSLNRYFRQNLHSHPSPAEREERLAIEAAAAAEEEDADAMSVDRESQQLARRDGGGRNRAVVTRASGGLGMMGVTDQKKREARRAEQKGRSLKDFSTRKNEWSVSKQANHQKYYNYQIL